MTAVAAKYTITIEGDSDEESEQKSEVSPAPSPPLSPKNQERRPLNRKVEFVGMDELGEGRHRRRSSETSNSATLLRSTGAKDLGNRYHQPRMSLLGKPINYRPHTKRDARYRKIQTKIYNFLERPRGCGSVIYHICV